MRNAVWPSVIAVMLLTACRGAAGRAAPLPHPTDLAGWLALAVFVIGIWWLAFKILRG
jgi:hypothetical protein